MALSCEGFCHLCKLHLIRMGPKELWRPLCVQNPEIVIPINLIDDSLHMLELNWAIEERVDFSCCVGGW